MKLVKKNFYKAQIVTHNLLLLNLISLGMKVYFKLIDIYEYQSSGYFHLLMLLLTLKVPLLWTLSLPFFLNIILTHVKG